MGREIDMSYMKWLSTLTKDEVEEMRNELHKAVANKQIKLKYKDTEYTTMKMSSIINYMDDFWEFKNYVKLEKED